MPIYTEKTANTIPVPPTTTPAQSFVCDYQIGSDKYQRLREFIFLCYNNKGKTYTFDGETSKFPHDNLWDYFFKYIVVKDAGGIPIFAADNLPQILPLPLSDSVQNLIQNRYAAEAATLFAYFYASLNLAIDTRYIINDTLSPTPKKYYQNFDFSIYTPDTDPAGFVLHSNLFSQPLTIEKNKGELTNIALNPKSYIFEKLRSVLTEFGFKPSANLSIVNKIEVNSLLDPFNNVGSLRLAINLDTNMEVTIDTNIERFDKKFTGSFLKNVVLKNSHYSNGIKNQFYFKFQFSPFLYSLLNTKFEDSYSKIGDDEAGTEFELNTKIFEESSFNNYIEEVFKIVKTRNASILNTAKSTPEFKTRVAFYIIEKISVRIDEEVRKYISTEVVCFFKKILNSDETIQSIILGTGDGSSTSGILGIQSFGCKTFTYNFLEPYSFNKVLPINKLNVFSQNSKQVIHLKVFGQDKIIPSTITVRNAYSQDTEWIKLVTDAVNTDLTLDSVSDNLMIDVNKIYTKNNSGLKDKLYAEFFPNVQDLKFEVNSGEEKDVLIDLKSAGSGTDFDEIQLLAIVVNQFTRSQIVDEPRLIKVKDRFDDDKFELESSTINSTILTSADDIIVLKNVVDSMRANTANLIINLSGQFVGKRKATVDTVTSEIEADSTYLPRNTPPPVNQEVGAEPAGANYKELKYSFGTLQITPSGSTNNVNITIDSWVSPKRSRLDDRFTKNTAFPDNDIVSGQDIDYDWDYRNDPIPPPFHTGAPSLPAGNSTTISNMSTLLDSFTLPNYDLTITYNSSTATIKSYNQALACLRSLGTLESVFYRLYDVWIANYPSEVTQAKTKLKSILNSTTQVVQSLDKTGTSRGNPGQYELSNPITYTDYKNLKWYRLFKTTDIIGTSKVKVHNDINNDNYEYFLYRHELD